MTGYGFVAQFSKAFGINQGELHNYRCFLSQVLSEVV